MVENLSINVSLIGRKKSQFVFFSTTSGVYGDVHRVKILFNKKDNALIQYAEPQQAQLGSYNFILFYESNGE